MKPIVERARAIAEDVLFPAAMDTDASDLLPVTHLDLLAREGLYGIAGPAEAAGMDLDSSTTRAVVESLASGCLTTAFVWLQHRNPVRAVAASATAGLRDEWLAPLCRGDRRAGIAFAGNRPGTPILSASRTARGDVVLNGEAPWVSGWGRIDVVLVTAREGGSVVSVLMDATETPTAQAERLHLVGANASSTVTLRFRDHMVPVDRVVGEEPHADVLARDAASLQLNGSLALGLVDRCCRLMGPSAFDEGLVAVRESLDEATPETVPRARAAASELALRAAAALTVAHGSPSILADHHPQRLAREAVFLLVFGSRPPIRAELSRRIATTEVRAPGTLLPMHVDTSFEPIVTPRLRLRRSRPQDADAISAYRSDPEVHRYQGWERTDPAGVRGEIEEMARRAPGAPGGWMQLSIEDRETGQLLGDVGLSPVDDEQGVIKIGYTVSPSFQGHGYATEAVGALIAYAFDTLGAEVVRAYASAENISSIRVAEKVGMQLVERFERRSGDRARYVVRYELHQA